MGVKGDHSLVATISPTPRRRATSPIRPARKGSPRWTKRPRHGGAPGSAKITVKTYNGKSKSVSVTVRSAPVEGAIKLNAAPKTLAAGKTYQLKASYSKGYAGAYTFLSDNEGVATVDEAKGRITAVSAGTANITVTPYNSKA